MRISARRRAEMGMISGYSESSRPDFKIKGQFQDVVQIGSGEPLVLVPGLAGSWKLMYPLAKRLARKHLVIIPTLRGDSNPLSANKPKEIADLSEDLGLTIEALGLERPLVMGVSFGGAIALEYAVDNPGKLGGLVLYGVDSSFRMGFGASIAQRVLERFPLPSDNGFVNQFFNVLHGRKPEPGPLTDFIVERCWETDQAVMAHRLRLLENFDVSDRLWRVETPTLVLAGTRDVVVPLARQRELARTISGANFASVEGAGHIGFLTHRLEVAKQMAQFTRQLRRMYC